MSADYRLHLVTTVGGDVSLLPFMLSHYRDLGIGSFLINVHASCRSDGTVERITEIAEPFGAVIESIAVAPWSEHINPLLNSLSRCKRPRDWFVLADVDELQGYPAALPDIIEFCDKHGFDFVEGCVVDRTTEDGTLSEVREDESLFDQYPTGSLLSGVLLDSVINKVVLARGGVRIGRGQHHPHSGRGCPPAALYIPVYHFKWTAGLKERLEARIKLQQELGEGIWRENARLIAHYETHGRIRVEEPEFLAGSCKPEYEHWEKVREWKIAQRFFRWFPG